MLVDNEHQCQLFYRSPPFPHLLPLAASDPSSATASSTRHAGAGSLNAKGHGSFDPWPLRFITTGRPRPWHPSSAYVADAPGGAGSTSRIRPRSGTRDVVRFTTRSIRSRTGTV